MPTSLARRYAELIDRHRWRFLVGSLLLVGLGLALAMRLPIETDTSVLLPPDAPSVQDLRAIEQRARATGSLLVLVQAPDDRQRAAAATDLHTRLADGLRGLGVDIVEDDLGARRWAWERRFLFASLEDLEAARDGLARRLERAKLKMNPAYVSFEDEEATGPEDKRLDDLERTWQDAEDQARRPQELVSKDRRTQLFVLRTAIVAGEVEDGARLDATVSRIADQVMARHHGVRVGITGDIHTAVLEQRAILGGMVTATAITLILVVAGMLLYFRSWAGVGAVLGALVAGVLVTFGATKLVVGQLNSVSAFLAAIVGGVGIDFGIMLLARYLEELRGGQRGVEALARALGGSAPATLTAAAATGAAYASLTATQFRGFREFGVIGGMGMALCWIAAYTTLPALIAILARAGRIHATTEPGAARLLDRLLGGRRPGIILAVGAIFTVGAAILSWHFLERSPYEHDLTELRSTSHDARVAREWSRLSSEEFGKVSSAFVVAAPSREGAREVARALRQDDAGRPEKQRRFGRIVSLDDLIPTEQGKKLAVLEQIRRSYDDKALDALDAGERARLERFRPPDEVLPVTDADIPERLAGAFIEKDGSRGRVLLVSFGPGVGAYDADSLEAFADHLRKLDLPEGVHFGGSAFVFADITRAVKRDGVRATLWAIVGVTLFVILFIGLNRHGLVTLSCVVAGTLFMIAGASLLGLKINFLDFAALPLTLGISVDYSANIVLRHRAGGGGLHSTGSAVALCSYTTIVAYGSLALSDNAGIRSFGAAATLGELTCLVTALVLGSALLRAGTSASARDDRRSAPPR